MENNYVEIYDQYLTLIRNYSLIIFGANPQLEISDDGNYFMIFY